MPPNFQPFMMQESRRQIDFTLRQESESVSDHEKVTWLGHENPAHFNHFICIILALIVEPAF